MFDPRRAPSGIFEAPDPASEPEAYDAWAAEQDALALAGHIPSSLPQAARLDVAARLNVLGFHDAAGNVLAAVLTSTAAS